MARGVTVALLLLALLAPARRAEASTVDMREASPVRSGATGAGQGPARQEPDRQPPPPPSPVTQIELPIAVRNGDVYVRATDGLDRLAAAVAAAAPGVLATISDDLPGLPRPTQIEIRLVPDVADIAAAAPPGHGPPEWADGVAYPGEGVIVVATRRGGRPIMVTEVVAHELAHLALGAALGGRAPRWLDEGFAYLHAPEWSEGRVTTLTGMVWFGNPIPLDRLEGQFHGGHGSADRAYAQSYDMVVYLARRGRYPDHDDDGDRWAFRDFLHEIAAGADVYGASQTVYRMPLPELFDEWYQDLRQRYLLIPAELFALSLWVFGALLLFLAWWRRRRQNRARLARWDADEAARLSEIPDKSDEPLLH